MDMSAALGTAIGLIMMYLVLSLFCTTINELIAMILNLRANTLRDALAKLIDVDALKNEFYRHGLIDSAKVAATAGDTPSAKAEGGASFKESKHPTYLSPRAVAMALLDCAVFQDTKNLDTIPSVESVKTAVLKLPDSNVRDALISCLAQAEGDMTRLRDAVANWFDTSMDRLSGAYKRKMQIISAVVGFVLAAFFNADTLQVGVALWNDSSLSAAISQSATQVVNDKTLTKKCDSDPDPIGCQSQNLKQLNDRLRPLPLGWTRWPGGLDWLWKILGIAATTIALTLGAPFWFDLLTQFVNLRGSKPDEKTA